MELLERFQEACKKRGATGIRGLGRAFRIYDDDGNKQLNYDEFKTGVEDYGIQGFSDSEYKELFNFFDKDGGGSVNIDEFLRAVRPHMNESRIKVVKQAFAKCDKTGDGVITEADLKGVYNARCHPKYQNGEWTEAQVFRSFLDTFDDKDNSDGKVTLQEFLDYYNGVSVSIDQDVYFDLMIRNAWKI